VSGRTIDALRGVVATAERELRYAEAAMRRAAEDLRDAQDDVREARALLDAALATEVPCG